MKTVNTRFTNGQQLCRAFYENCVWPLLRQGGFAALSHSAGLLDSGSEVFGFDDTRSTDHHWGPRVLVFLSDDDHSLYADTLTTLLSRTLPYEFMGYSTNFGPADDIGVQLLAPITQGPINHRVQFFTSSSFFKQWLNNVDPSGSELSLKHWQALPQQALFAIRNGAVFRDDLHIESVRKRLHFYPKQVWLEKLIRQWSHIEKEQAFIGRTGDVDDEIGSRLIASRLLVRLMKITFLLEKEYYPYSKWFGTAFSRLKSAATLQPFILGTLTSSDWVEREENLCHCYTAVIELHNSVNGLPNIELDLSFFFDRPFRVPHAEQIVATLRRELKTHDKQDSNNSL